MELLIIAAEAMIIFILWEKCRFFKHSLRDLNRQLEKSKKTQFLNKVDISLGSRELERLGENINDWIDVHFQQRARSKEKEKILKKSIANMSHDLRTPLTSILGYMQLIEDEKTTEEERKKYLKIAREKGHSLQCLLNDFFELSVIESVDYNLSLECIRLDTLVSEKLFSYYDVFVQQEITPEIKIPEKALNVLGEKETIHRVLDNLLGNVLKYGREDVKIELFEQGEEVVIEISNRAPSLTEEMVSKLFDRFYKADKVRMGKGAGLGLCIAKSLMEKMEGSLEAHLENKRLIMKCCFKKQKNLMFS